MMLRQLGIEAGWSFLADLHRESLESKLVLRGFVLLLYSEKSKVCKVWKQKPGVCVFCSTVCSKPLLQTPDYYQEFQIPGFAFFFCGQSDLQNHTTNAQFSMSTLYPRAFPCMSCLKHHCCLWICLLSLHLPRDVQSHGSGLVSLLLTLPCHGITQVPSC